MLVKDWVEKLVGIVRPGLVGMGKLLVRGGTCRGAAQSWISLTIVKVSLLEKSSPLEVLTGPIGVEIVGRDGFKRSPKRVDARDQDAVAGDGFFNRVPCCCSMILKDEECPESRELSCMCLFVCFSGRFGGVSSNRGVESRNLANLE